MLEQRQIGSTLWDGLLLRWLPLWHDCVTVINNFLSRARLDYYTRPQGSEIEPKLPPKLAGPLHKIIMTTNLNPVKMVMLVKEDPLLVDVMQKCLAFLQERDDNLDALLKSLLKGRDSDGFPQYQEKFIRDCIQKFPYCEATLLQQLVRSIAPLEIGNDPTVFSVLTQALTGQMVLMDTEYCPACGEKGADKKCSFCKMVVYCGPACQRLHWFTHKRQCKTPLSQRGSRQPKLRELSSHVDDNDVVDAASSMLALCLGLSKCALQNRPSDDHSETSEDPPCAGKD